MRNGKDVTGLPVFTFDTGEKIAEVKDLLYDPERHTLLALLIDEGGWFKEARTVPFRSIKSIGPDVIVVPSADAVVEAKSDPEIARAVDSDRVVIGNHVLTESGEDLGRIDDIAFDDKTGKIEGYYVTGGFFADKFKGKPFVPAPDTVRVGKQVVYVPDETAQKMQEQVGGIAGAVKATGESTQSKLGELQETTGGKVTGAMQAVRQKAGEMGDQVSGLTKDQQKNYVVGKTAQHDVRTDKNELIAGKGQTVTQEMADRADKEGKLGELAAAVGGAELVEASRTMQEQARGLFETVKGKFGETTTQFQERQLDAIKGEKANREVKADDDTLIVAKDQVITDDVVEMAKRHHKEKALLAAVGLGKAQDLHDTALCRTLEFFGESPQSTQESAQEQGSKAAKPTAPVAAHQEMQETEQPQIRGSAQAPVVEHAETETTRMVEKPEGVKVATTVQRTTTMEGVPASPERGNTEDLLGQTAGQSIVDNHGNVILEAGQTITQEALERAWEAGKLDELRASVYAIAYQKGQSNYGE